MENSNENSQTKDGMGDGYPSSWIRPIGVHRICRVKTQKRALEKRFDTVQSPAKKTKACGAFSDVSGFKHPFNSTSILQNDDSNCHDTTLIKTLGLHQHSENSVCSSSADDNRTNDSSTLRSFNFSSLFCPNSSSSSTTDFPRNDKFPIIPPRSLSSSFKSSFDVTNDSNRISLFLSKSPVKNRKTLIPKTLPISPSFSPKRKTFRVKPKLSDIPSTDKGGPEWQYQLCLDWSLKSFLTIISPNAFAWNSELKTSEESSGTSSFVRCIDSNPNELYPSSILAPNSSQLDTSLGAQFHQCCLYWQHPSLPGLTLFPRDMRITKPNQKANPISILQPSIQFDKNALDVLLSEWISAFQSIFHLVKSRQCPFFYVCLSSCTCLVSSAGTQGNEQIQVYITPCRNSLIDALQEQGINFTLPYNSLKPTPHDHDSESEEEIFEDELEINCEHISGNKVKKRKDRSSVRPAVYKLDGQELPSLVLITGSDTLAFFNFLMGSKSLLIDNVGPLTGVPPTILSPVAFHGATLKTLKVHQRKLKGDSLDLYAIDMKGPILPHVLHNFTSLLNKTVKNYKMKLKTLESTIPLNLHAALNPINDRIEPSAFDIQNLSDCGLKKELLEVFCKSDNCDTIQELLEGKRRMYRWY